MSLQLTLPAEAASVERARHAVQAHLAPLALAPRAAYRLELVLEETVMNLATHAFPAGGGHFDLQVDVVDGKELVLRFSDDGIAFDPVQAAVPARPASLEAAVPGGLGLMLVRRNAQRIDYRRRDGRNVLTVALAIEGGAGA
jgi:anti-sigma regulatory factor (Ser/Thr protein kinase)